MYRENDLRRSTGRVEGRGGIAQNTEQKQNYPHEIARDQMVPKIVDRNLDAINVDPHLFHFYQRKQMGRRCSCYNVETSPDGLCQVCWGTGIVGGYTKWGTVDHVIDVTAPKVNAVNVLPSFDQQIRPVMFVLANTATSGYIQTRINITSNSGILDALQIIPHNIKQGNKVIAYVKRSTDLTWTELDDPDILEGMLDASFLDFRVVLWRASPESEIPFLSHIMLRYRLRENISIKGDIPRVPESQTLAEFGLFDSFSAITIWTANEPSVVTTEDFFHEISTGRRWKIIESNPNTPEGILTSHDLQARLVQRFEAYSRVP